MGWALFDVGRGQGMGWALIDVSIYSSHLVQSYRRISFAKIDERGNAE